MSVLPPEEHSDKLWHRKHICKLQVPMMKISEQLLDEVLDKSRQQYYRQAREHSFLEIRFQLKSHILTTARCKFL